MYIASILRKVYLAAIACIAVSCGGGRHTESTTPAFDAAAWKQSVEAAWTEQDVEFKNSKTSPLKGAHRFEITEMDPCFFFINQGKVEWSTLKAKQARLVVEKTGEGWTWKGLYPDVQFIREDGGPETPSILEDGDSVGTGGFHFEFYPLPDQLIVLVFDDESPQAKDFEALERFPADPKYVVQARIEKIEPPVEMELMTARQKIKKRYKYATLHFEIDGVNLELLAFKYALEGEWASELFLPFTDKTSGKDSYGGGRYLGVTEPEQGDTVEIDFNLATNPLCSYAPIYNCIVPPRENRLEIEIQAGEKKFH